MSCTVTTIPLYWRPFYYLYAYGMGTFLLLVARGLHHTCRITHHGQTNDGGAKIFVTWHHNNMPFFVVAKRTLHKEVWLNHPLWYMKPVHLLLSYLGVKKLIYGSTGNNGKKALDRIIEAVNKGHHTRLNPDGPGGPPRKSKKGAIILAQQTQRPLIPLYYKTSCALKLNKTWDGKRFPLPGSRIDVYYGSPLFIPNEMSIDEGRKLLETALNELETASAN